MSGFITTTETAAGWAARIGLTPQFSPLAIRIATFCAALFCEHHRGLAIRPDKAAHVYGVSESDVVRAIGELVAGGYLRTTFDDRVTRYHLSDPDPTHCDVPRREEGVEDYRANKSRRRRLRRRWLKILPGATPAELLLIGVESIQRGEATIFDLAAIVETPATLLVNDFERLVGRRATVRDWGGDNDVW